MPRQLQKSLSSSKQWFLKQCKHPRTLSFSQTFNNTTNTNNKDEAATLADIDQFLFENFRSLYINDDEKQKGTVKDEEKDLKGVFYESNGSSNSSISVSGSGSSSANNKTDESSSSSEDNDGGLPEDCIAILTATPKPYEDFRRSMEGMVETRLKHDGKVDWDYMEELLFCYLNLNGKKSYKDILRAFVDLVVLLREGSPGGDVAVPVKSRRFRFGQSRRRVRNV